MILLDGENIAIPINSRSSYLTIHDCCATSYADLVQATEKVSWNEYNKKNLTTGISISSEVLFFLVYIRCIEMSCLIVIHNT